MPRLSATRVALCSRVPGGCREIGDRKGEGNAVGNLGILLDAKACQLEEDGASDPAALAQIYTEAADMLAFSQSLSQSPSLSQFAAKDEDVLRCRKRAAELTGS